MAKGCGMLATELESSSLGYHNEPIISLILKDYNRYILDLIGDQILKKKILKFKMSLLNTSNFMKQMYIEIRITITKTIKIVGGNLNSPSHGISPQLD